MVNGSDGDYIQLKIVLGEVIPVLALKGQVFMTVSSI